MLKLAMVERCYHGQPRAATKALWSCYCRTMPAHTLAADAAGRRCRMLLQTGTKPLSG